MSAVCHCSAPHRPRLAVVTGGPGAGKTAVLEIARRHFCEHVVVLPEAASILFAGGFPRENGDVPRRAAQRAIFGVQRELERIALAKSDAALVLCDRGTLDGLAYWPGDEDSFFEGTGTSRAAELLRYAGVIHLRTPSTGNGYDSANPLRIESARQAHVIDEKIVQAWRGHGDRTFIPAAHDFVTKVSRAITAITALVPDCCTHATPVSDEARVV